jgi:Mrp family chromosome partitioning ATPase
LLDLRVNGRRPQVIQLLSTEPDDERDKMARLLALEFARGRSKETLLVDLQEDGRSHLAALGTQPVSVERIDGHVLAFNTIFERLWVTYEAQQSDLMNTRVDLTQVQGVLAQLRQAFEVVVIIGPDPSASYATRRIAGLVDANILVVRGERTEAGPAREDRDSVLSAGGRILGLAFTGQRQIVPQRIERLIGA